MIDRITVRGARQHNLKNINVEIPRHTLSVVTGLSGSGKSSLAFDIIYAEGQRRYVQTLSAYARQFLDQMERPDVDSIEGLSPAISIEQKTTSRSARSTVGTITEIYDYLRLLYASIGIPHCHKCGRLISRQTTEQIVASIMALAGAESGVRSPESGEDKAEGRKQKAEVREQGKVPGSIDSKLKIQERESRTPNPGARHPTPDSPSSDGGARVMILAPVVRGRKGEFASLFEQLSREGFVRARVDGQLRQLDEEIPLQRRANHTIEVVVDRLLVKPGIESRLAASIETAIKLAKGIVQVAVVGGAEHLYSQEWACVDCGISIAALEPRSFSFNSVYGACSACRGLGSQYSFDPAKLIVDWSRPLLEGGLGPGAGSSYMQRSLARAAEQFQFDLKTPFNKFPRKVQNLILYGKGPEGSRSAPSFRGIVPLLDQWYSESTSESYREWFTRYMSAVTCPQCEGKRLKPESLAATVAGLSIADFTALPIGRAQGIAQDIQLNPREEILARRILSEISERLKFLRDVGLEYLSLNRSAATLSSGESQRIRLATQIGSKLRGVLYVLDEPSIGLHPRDNERLLQTLEHLRDLGNTVLVVEHDEETIRRANHVVDLGPGAGKQGGFLVAEGTPEHVAETAASLTGRYLSGTLSIPVPETRRRPNGKFLRVLGARAHNLKNIDVNIPLGVITVVTGVSGSGKSTLVNDIIYRAIAKKIYRALEEPGDHRALQGLEHIDKVIEIDQAPIGRTPRSNPATYTGLFSPIRDLFAMLPESRQRGYRAGRFSFNVKGGRCEACQGDGLRRIEMSFLPDVFVTCEVCRGRRYNSETLAVKYKGASVADLLDSTVKDALPILENIPVIKLKLQTLLDVGLGYIHLGQSSTTLSGGEAQRIKLAKELSKRQTGRTLYILDEPTTGLHFDDVKQLMEVLNRLTDLGNTIIIIEHNLDVVKQADWLIDLGPEGGEAGGRVVAEGTPEDIAANKKSYTGQALAKVLKIGK
ncbi:MAG TPA: excinuclease ABC subunit UvrA [Terriglobia bacterium]|nr:excinuclease ABC subunit UvrA [Terriglobia bacterium]